MTAQQKEDLLYNIESIWDHFKDYKDRAPELFPGWLKSKLANIRQDITNYSHDYSVIAIDYRDVQMGINSKPYFEFNTDSLDDAHDIFDYWKNRIRKDAVLILQDNHATDCALKVKWPH